MKLYHQLKTKRENYIFIDTYTFAIDLVPLVLEVVTLCRYEHQVQGIIHEKVASRKA